MARATRARLFRLQFALLSSVLAALALLRSQVVFPSPQAPALARAAEPASGAPVYGFRVVNAYPHDPAAFTQGLAFANGRLYEGTGLRGRSSLREVELETGRVLRQRKLPPTLFGEGVTLVRGRLVQLTWQARLGLVYDEKTFALKRTFRYPTQGWGITFDGQRLIMSDGTATLYFLNSKDFSAAGSIRVHDGAHPVNDLNELEYVSGEIYANVWKSDRIARIDPSSGRVVGWIDLSGLLPDEQRLPSADVLNGIAYDAAHDRLFVTGKLWPQLFEIALVARP